MRSTTIGTPLVDVTRVDSAVDSSPETLSTSIVVRGPGRVKVRFGDPIAVRPNSETLHVFDVETGERLD